MDNIRAAIEMAEPFDAWPEPDLSVLNEGRRRPPELPVEVFGPWKEWLNATAAGCSAPVDYVAASLLASAAATIGNARWVKPWDGWKEPCSLWFAAVGKPSSGKSPATTPILEILRLIEQGMAEGFEDKLLQWETDKEAAKVARENWQSEIKQADRESTPPPVMPALAIEPEKPVRPRIITSDATIEAISTILSGQPKGLLSTRDELSGWLGSFNRYNAGGGERAFWLEAFGGRAFTVDRVKSDRPIKIPNLTISVLGGIQPDRLTTMLMSGDDDGLASRMLFVWPEPLRPCRPRIIADKEAALDAFRRLHSLQMALDEYGELTPTVISLTPDAADVFENWRKQHYEDTQSASGMLSGFYGKASGVVLRLALVLEHLWWSWGNDDAPQYVTLKAITAAAALISGYFGPMAERTYGDAALPIVERNAATIARWIMKEQPTELNIRKLYHDVRLPGLREPKPTHEAFRFLEEFSLVRPNPSREGKSPGRKKGDFLVNPKIFGGVA
jgi:hypothetical protein